MTEEDETYEVDLSEASSGQESEDEVRMDEVVSEEMPKAAEEEIERLRAEAAEIKDAYLRLRADFENSRKRMEREKGEYHRFALGGAVREILPVVDNLDRALENATDREDDFVEGVRMIRHLFDDVLGKLGVQAVGRTGDPFDPNLHEAVAREDRSDVPSHSILEVLQKGYVLNDRLIRPAMVKVAIGEDDSSGQSAAEDSGDDDGAEPDRED